MSLRILYAMLVSVWCVAWADAGLDVYVAADAAPGGNGSRGKPYQTLEQARDAIRLLRRAEELPLKAPVTVLVEPGAYGQGRTFELTSNDSGTANSPIVYRSRKQGKARLNGGVLLEPSSFTPLTDPAVLQRLDPAVRSKVLVCDLRSRLPGAFEAYKTAYQGSPVSPWLYMNRQPMTLARWPNADLPGGGWAQFEKATDTGLPKADAQDPALRKAHPGSFIFNDDRPARWNIGEGVWLQGYWCHDWADETIRIGSYDAEKKIITMAAPHSYGLSGSTWGASKRRFFALNLLEELDAPGEWYLDRGRKQLYFYPPTPLKDATICLATLTQPLVKVDGAKNVKLIDFAFEYVHSDGIILNNAENVEIAGCEVANCTGGGISVNGRENVVRSCDLFNLGRGGISLNGGDRKALVPANNLAVNNHIHHYGLFQRTYAPGVGANGCGQVVRNNCIHDAPHNAVLYGGNEHLFELNEIYRVVMETGDAGAFYTGRDWASQGNVLKHNFIHDLGVGETKQVNTMGVYLDDCDSGDTIEGNVFYRAGRAIMIGGGRDNPILNNLVVDCPIALHIDSRGTTWPNWNNTNEPSWCLEAKAQVFNYTNPPWSVKYPKLAAIMNEEPRQPLGNTLRRNVFVDCTKKACNFDGNVKTILDRLDIAENLVVGTTRTNGIAIGERIKGFRNLAGSQADPITLGFRDPASLDFSLKWHSRLMKELPTFEKIPFDKIGLYKDAYRRTLSKKRD